MEKKRISQYFNTGTAASKEPVEWFHLQPHLNVEHFHLLSWFKMSNIMLRKTIYFSLGQKLHVWRFCQTFLKMKKQPGSQSASLKLKPHLRLTDSGLSASSCQEAWSLFLKQRKKTSKLFVSTAQQSVRGRHCHRFLKTQEVLLLLRN